MPKELRAKPEGYDWYGELAQKESLEFRKRVDGILLKAVPGFRSKHSGLGDAKSSVNHGLVPNGTRTVLYKYLGGGLIKAMTPIGGGWA